MGETDHSTPHLTAVVHRERLLKRLRMVMTPGIVVVSAPAAQGKSTLITDHLSAINARTCWIDLRPEDAEPEMFCRHLQKVCRVHQLPPSNASINIRSHANTAQGTPHERIADLLYQLPADLHLVFDNWHRLGSSSQSAAWRDALLAVCPAEGCLYFISREDVPINLQGKRIRHQALLVTGDELAFTEEEIEAYLNSVAGVSMDGAHWGHVQEVTSGWAGSLVLLTEALHRQQGNALELLHSPFLSTLLQTETRDFFQDEIYDHQPRALKRFLVLAALPETATAEVMQDQLGQGEADRLFTEATRRNLFMQIMDANGGHWRFRFNPLFRAFLLEKGRERLTKQTIHAVLRKAANRSEAAGRHAEAVRYYLGAGDTRAAAINITKIGLELTIEGRFAEIDSWTAMLPTDLRQKDPWLALLQAVTFRIRGGQRTIRELVEIKASFDQAGRLRESMLSLAYLIETAVFIGYDPAARTQWIAQGDALLKKASRMPHFTYVKALLWQQIGFATIAAGSGNLRQGLSACQNAVILGKSMDANHLVANALTIAAHAHVQVGDFEQARESLAAAEARADGDTFPEYGALRDLTHIHLEMIGGHFAMAANLLKRLGARIDTLGLIILYPDYIEASGLLQIYRQEYAAMEKTRHHMRDVAILLNNSIYSARASWLDGLGGYHQGQYGRARAALQPAIDTVDLPAADCARSHELMGFITLNLGQLNDAAAHFKEALTIFEGAGMPLGTSETQIGQALVQHARMDARDARDHLEAAFHAAIACGCDHFPVIRTADLERACALGQELGISSATEHARHLLATGLSELQPRSLTPDPSPDPPAPFSDTGGMPRTFPDTHPPTLAIRTFGRLEILRNDTHPIAAERWQGSRPALLLKAILVHGCRHIPKDILIEALWPDQPPEKSLRNFKVTLHRLRKLFEPDMKSSTGSAYIHLKDNLVSLDAHLCQVDTDAFHRLCKTVRRAEPGADRDLLLEMSREAVRLYQGDFLPEEPYLSWAEMKRATLREEFLQLMYLLGQLFCHRHEFGDARSCYRRIIRIDPAQEKAQRRLMRLLADAGRSGEAVRLYRDFKAYLETEIGAAPDAATTRLFRTISDQMKP